MQLNTIRKVPQFPDYEVTASGELYSYRPMNKSCGRKRRLVKGSVNKGGYLKTAIKNNKGKNRYCLIHVLILESFIGKRPHGKNSAHNNGNKLDNRIKNLRWATQKENNDDKKKHGTWQVGEKASKSKLKNKDVLHILRMLNKGIGIPIIASRFRVSYNSILSIKRGKSWSHITKRKIRCT